MFEDTLEKIVLGNRILDYLFALGYIIVGLVAVWVMRKIILVRLKKWAEKTATTLDDFIIRNFQRTILPLLYFAVFYFSLRSLTLHPTVDRIMTILAAVLLSIFGIRFLVTILEHMISHYWLKRADDQDSRAFRGLLPAIKIVIWGVGFIFLLDNLGVEISAVLAGVGIGGIAVALAAQAILGDLFSYFSILFDRPFEVGDFIIVGDLLGSVEYIGIKTTRLRSLGGEQLVFSNTDLTNSRVKNYKRMEKRRVLFRLGVTYDTPKERVEEIPKLIANIIQETDNANFDRAHFGSYGDFSLNIEVVYYVTSGDYNLYMDVQQTINLRIMEEFQKRNIQFAFPTRTLHVHKSELT